MFMAVLEGLYVDGVSNDVIDLIIPNGGFHEHFIYGCPMCMPTYDAMVLYRSRLGFYGMKPPDNPPDTFGPGVDAGLRAKLAGTDKEMRLRAIESLIRTWIDRRVDLMSLSEAEETSLRQELERGSKKGGELLERHREADAHGVEESRTFCAVCRAATKQGDADGGR
jgi:hypothetical protein